MELSGQVAIVTGAGRGIGRATALELAQMGADIVIAGRSTDSSLSLGPLIHEFGWAPADYDLLAAGTLLVIDGSRTKRKVAKTALKRLVFARAHVVGAVINRLPQESAQYGYGYDYGGYGPSSVDCR